MTQVTVVTRFAPSPTGLLHVGNYRTALFSYLYARQHQGRFLLRIEDTDKARSKKEYEDNILESLKWLGLEHDGDIVRQSDRATAHRAYLEKMIADGTAYISKETPKEPGQNAEVIRFKNPNVKITFHDLIRGDITFDTTELHDFIIAKSLDEPVFHFAVVADDFDMGITHIVRGEDHISNTPRQILIQRAIGAPQPTYAHLPLVLAPDRSKLSKRRGALAVTEYRDRGYLPETILNYMALLGWNPGTEQELFSKEELVTHFSLERVQKSGAMFNEEKLKWINKEYIKRMPITESARIIENAIKPFVPSAKAEILTAITPLILERVSTFGEIGELFKNGEFLYFFNEPNYKVDDLFWKDEKNPKKTWEKLSYIQETLSKIPQEIFTELEIKKSVWDYATQEGRGSVLWPFRFALSGVPKSPDPFVLAATLGKDITLKRIQKAIALLK